MNEHNTGLVREKIKDPRRVTVEEVAKAFGAPTKPLEYFSPYLVAAYLSFGTNDQNGRQDCVFESTDKVNEAISAWEITPNEIPDGGVIDYLFDYDPNGKISLKPTIKNGMDNFSPVFGYYIAKQIDGLKGSGTYLVYGGKVSQDYGLAHEKIWPSAGVSENKARYTKPSQEAYDDAKPSKIVRYAESGNTMESYKLGIWTGNGNAVIGGYDLGGGANVSVQPQKPPTSEPDEGHANCFFGYDPNYIYSIGSWGEGFGLTLYLKIINDPKFGKVFVRGTSNDYAVAIRGCHQLGNDWFPKYSYGVIALYDKKFTPELEEKINMLQTLREEETGRVFAILGSKAFWVTPGGSPGTVYEDGRGKLWLDVGPDQVPAIKQNELRSKYPDRGIWGKPTTMELLKFILGQI
jgi:hypothetical protein